MKVTLESTAKLVELDGVLMRVWEGTTEKSVPVLMLVARVMIPEGQDASESEADLRETRMPSPVGLSLPLRLVS